MRIPFALHSFLCLSLIFSAQLVQAAEALDLLENANEAAHKLNYSGTYVYHHGEHVEVLRVSHRVDKRGEMHKVEVLDGPHREFLRINDEIYCHMADGKTVRIDKSTVQRFFPAVVPDDLTNLARYYIPRLGGIEKVAGRECQVVVLEPRDDFRFTQVLWLDRQTMLPLKMSTIDNHGAPVSIFVFSEIEIGKQPEKAIFDVRMAGKRMQPASLPASPLGEEAWAVTPPPGYSKILEAMRPLPGKKMPVLHRVYSDGMSNLSIFIEPIVNSASHLEGLSTEGAINIYGRRVADHKVTAIGEVPAAALLETANSVQKR
jgi:sigma-E factor negative regulatory protein RseB